MRRMQALVIGDLMRLTRYNLFSANMAVMVLWILLSWFLPENLVREFLPMVFLMDSVMMTVLLVGATLFYEKKEHTMNSILVSPATDGEYLLSKIVVSVINALITAAIVCAVLYFMKGTVLNYAALVGAILVVTAFHTLVGVWMCYITNGFTSLLIVFMIYALACALPTALITLGLLPGWLSGLLIVLPVEASNNLFALSIRGVDTWKALFGYAYLIALGALLYLRVILPRFGAYSMEELGV